MIVFRVRNRLGDQLLKYAAARALAKHHRTDVAADLWWVRELNKGFRYYLPGLGFNVKIVDHCDFLYDDRGPKKPYDKWALFGKSDNIVLGGLWYHHRYFDTIINEMRQEVRSFDVPEGITGIHVRRGDFVNIKNRVECTKEYIEKAIKIFPADEYLITTDDEKWCKRELSHITDRIYIYSTKPVDDFLRLKSCSRLIISASAFSWWAALLADCPTIAPKYWFHNKRKLKNLPDNWISI